MRQGVSGGETAQLNFVYGVVPARHPAARLGKNVTFAIARTRKINHATLSRAHTSLGTGAASVVQRPAIGPRTISPAICQALHRVIYITRYRAATA